MSRLQRSSSGRPQPRLERLDAGSLRATLNDALDRMGLPHSTRQAVGNLGRRKLYIEPEEGEEDTPYDVLP